MPQRHLLSGDDVRQLVTELANLLAPGEHREIIVAGGSLLALHGLRDSTADIDSLTPLDSTLRSHIAIVAAQHDLSDTWLNDHARPFSPSGLAPQQCDVMIEHDSLRLLGVPLHMVFLMKIDRAQEQDVADMVRLWPLVKDAFRSIAHVVDEYMAAYPLAREDPYLAQFLAEVIRRSDAH
ncbi:MAG: hypothetical protein RLZZ88_727 [Actinomycetota bacterium]|jgi:hypothetical protein